MKYTYPKSYKVKPIKEQYQKIFELFEIKLNQIGNKSIDHLPKSEGIFVIPHWKLIGDTYNDAVLKVMEIMKASRPTYDWRSGNWTKEYLRQLPVKEKFWDKQKKEILLISAQFGVLHAGQSVQAVRSEAQSNELPFGIYECLIMLLTHPERLQGYDDLWVDCPGDEYSFAGDGAFSGAPRLCFSGGRVRFDTYDVSFAREYFGSVSAVCDAVSKLEARVLTTSEFLSVDDAILKVKEAGFRVIKEL